MLLLARKCAEALFSQAWVFSKDLSCLAVSEKFLEFQSLMGNKAGEGCWEPEPRMTFSFLGMSLVKDSGA